MQENIIEQEKENIDSVKYRGSVKISTLWNNKCLSSKEYHNAGTVNLFTFFANCLWGTPSSTADYKPCKIVLFTDGIGEDPSEYDGKNYTEDYAVSLPMIFDKTPTGTSGLGPTDYIVDGKVVGKKVSLHFRVPYLYMMSGQTGANVCKLGLFPSNVRFPVTAGLVDTTQEYGSMLAYFTLSKTENNETTFDPIAIPAAGDNFTIVVDWTMIISNK